LQLAGRIARPTEGGFAVEFDDADAAVGRLEPSTEVTVGTFG
jgi:hypothetical protein